MRAEIRHARPHARPHARRHELAGAAWTLVEPLLPRARPRRGRPWRDHRTVVNGILWVPAAGAPWRDAPERCGACQTLYERSARWTDDGTWDRVHRALLGAMQRRGQVDWSLSCVDGTSIRALKAAAGARGRTRHTRGAVRRREPTDQAGSRPSLPRSTVGATSSNAWSAG